MQKSAMASVPLLASMMFSLVAANYDAITGYVPNSDVTSHGMIDLDQKEMLMHMSTTGTDGVAKARDWAKAKNIYQNGANSGGKATLTVGALAAGVEKGASVTQGVATGTVKSAALASATTIVVTYTSICKEGGTDVQDLSGCFTTGGGAIDAAGVNIATASSVVNSYRTLAGFSTAAEAKMTGQEYYEVYKAYYGDGAYANQKIIDAFDTTGSCATCDDIARDQVVKKSSAYMVVWMYVIREMEDAIIDCSSGCIDCNDDPVHAWDEAVAFYSGSLEGTTQNSAGNLIFRVAEKRCGSFGTCAVPGDYGVDRMSFVNQEIIKEFNMGRDLLLAGKCVEILPIKRRIVQLMSVPMVQGTLRYAYKVEAAPTDSKLKSEGDVFAHAILPRVAVCDPAAAAVIRENLRWEANPAMAVGYAAIKAAFEGVYDCMGITCEMVGGYLKDDTNPAAGYIEGMEPCDVDMTPAPTSAPAPTPAAAPTPAPTPPADAANSCNPLLYTVLPCILTGAVVGAAVYFTMSSPPAGGEQELVANAA